MKGDTMTSRRKIIYWGISAVVLIVIITAIVFVSSALSFVKHAEFALHGNTIVIMTVDKYVKEYGKWPASWEDLRSVQVDFGIWRWPDDMKELQDIQEYVEVDFSATLGQVARQTPEDFQAIRPHGPAYGGWQRAIPSLLKTVQDTIAQKEKKTK
jgi:hypothetical protein